MKYDEERTRILARDQEYASANKRLDDTQELPSVSSHATPVFSREGTVRELPSLAPSAAGKADAAAHTIHRGQKRTRWVLAFAACFTLALFCGFLLSQALRDHEQTLEDSRQEAQQIELRRPPSHIGMGQDMSDPISVLREM